MIILESNDYGYTFIDESTGDYFCAFDNNDCNAPADIYPLFLGPNLDWSDFDEIPF